ncbi:Hemerythrin HHE cation binding domain-containing protein [Streptoalloteichus tenebrarius]|uniref:Hemerythrin HHE cation binding domain-containing protein n=1 Tax=Streptoalloteichus tenebrarius (strain ATCC 17920 / DSM 40477 / JCM 4838 / CBS 697.72 / NBRC 16177 / NCIMB 11028 / NRRL B-12390 / A12253. 1 / ISP 5477) TaxID=1933 RepID=A0ABT1HQD8_STRSD|nr:hemerythrin domain-containing protein [Streptoalloteichus tenebrarius]MCP2257707.1 Hemerythrin HHE cation binding domain-containing protein [Streptoalloteichus tenebrarius]BFE99939.1 hemerythrin domain-containing protein [Streptoalloteichus tenebrarius]
MTSPTNADLVAELTADHRAVERVFEELESGRGAPRHRRELADHVITVLVRHFVAEETHLYPAVRRALPDGDAVADRELGEHAEAERTMRQLDGVDPVDPRFDELCRKLVGEVRNHLHEEERELLPRLVEHCGQDELDALGARVRRAREVAPTRPHPSAPDRPPLDRLLAPGVALVDRMRDAATGRGGAP